MLYDANLPEIRAIVPMPDGTVYAAALGGSVAKQAQAAAQAAQGVTARARRRTTTITVEAQNTRPGGEIKPPDATATHSPSPAPPPQATTQFSPAWT